MRKYPELSLVGQCEVGLLPSIIDYFRAVFQWSMPCPPWDTQIWAAETFLLLQPCQPCAVCQKRRGRNGRSASTWRGAMDAWQKNVIETRSGGTAKYGHWCGVIFAQNLKLALLWSVLLGELGEESGDGKGREFLIRQGKNKGEGQKGWRKGRCVTKWRNKERKAQFQGRESGNMEGKLKTHFGKGE